MATLELGRVVPADQPLQLSPDDLVTHGVVFGMTGSGKTGLCLGLLEELALAGIPVIAVDLKGDLANLALTFPEHRPEDYRPWVDEQAAAREGLSPDEAARRLAEKRRAEADPARLKAWGEKVQVEIYTPGSEAVRPVNLLGSLQAPPVSDADLVSGTVSGLLGLVGRASDPLKDPEHVLLSQILDQAWQKGESVSLESLIARLVDPPFPRVGVFPVDTFYKPEERLALARELNAVLASPSFAPWTRGDGLDPAALIQARNGRTPVTIFYVAHLSEAERMFFLSLLLERVVAWTRSLAGTASLRALLYLDEVMGYLPPHPANPPSKRPIMTLLKQARSVGTGVLLATQNPVDVDYKALGNAGTWWIGRLQAAQDRERVEAGLLGAAGGIDPGQLRGYFDQLQSRVFLLKRAGSDALALMRTRNTLAYLRGPLTLAELKKLGTPAPPPPVAAPVIHKPEPTAAPPTPAGLEVRFLDPRVVFSSRMEGRFERFARPCSEVPQLAPALHAQVELRFEQKQSGFVADQLESRVYFPLDRGVAGEFLPIALEDEDLLTAWEGPAAYQPLPPELDEQKEWQAAQKTILEDIYRNLTRGQWVNADLKLYGRPEESREDFEARCQVAVEDRIAQKSRQLEERYRPKAAGLEERIRKEKARLERLEAQASGHRTEGILAAGEMLLGFFAGRKRSVQSVLAKGRTTRNAELSAREKAGDIESLEQDLVELEEELGEKLDQIRSEESQAMRAIESRPVRLKREDVRLKRLYLLWIPLSRRV